MIGDDLAEYSVDRLVFRCPGVDEIESAVQGLQRLMWVIAQIYQVVGYPAKRIKPAGRLPQCQG
jgi:hypothetical protein